MQPSLRSAERGFSLIELMVGITIGLLATLAVTQVMVMSEGQKRATSSGSDAQVNGALAIDTLRRSIQPAGYGFGASPGLLGCALTATFNGASAGLPATLAPITITDGSSGAPDTIRIFASGKSSFSVPLRVAAPGYDPAIVAQSQAFPVLSVRSVSGPKYVAGSVVAPGDLMIAAVSPTPASACEMFQVTLEPTSANVNRDDQPGKWNTVGKPANAYPAEALLVNMGSPSDVTYSISGNSLRVRSLVIATDGTPSFDGPVEMFPLIVQMQALYGKDTNADGAVDAWDNATPTTAAGWAQLVAVRVAIVARSSQYEREDVTTSNVQWDVGTAIAIAGATTCGSSKCLDVKIDNLTDWKRYRYRLFETVVPLRNMLWNS